MWVPESVWVEVITNVVLFLSVKQEDPLQVQKYLNLFLVLDNAFVSTSNPFPSSPNLRVRFKEAIRLV